MYHIVSLINISIDFILFISVGACNKQAFGESLDDKVNFNIKSGPLLIIGNENISNFID
jgi:hypothetical protein